GLSALTDGWGFGDVTARAQLGWQHGEFSHLVYVQAVAPTGRWQRGFSPIIGLHRPGIDMGWAFTWTDKTKKLQLKWLDWRQVQLRDDGDRLQERGRVPLRMGGRPRVCTRTDDRRCRLRLPPDYRRLWHWRPHRAVQRARRRNRSWADMHNPLRSNALHPERSPLHRVQRPKSLGRQFDCHLGDPAVLISRELERIGCQPHFMP